MHMKKGWKMVALSAALTGAVALVPMGASAHTIDHPLQKGTHGKDVNPVQKQLKKQDYYNGQVDGIYGKNTKNAVHQYQKDHGLATDGVYGSNTSNAMDQAKTKNKPSSHTSLLQQGSHGKAVKDIQTQLQHLHYYNGNIDSIFGPRTESATKALQSASHIAVDGIVGTNTKKALENHPVSANAVKHQSSQHTSKQKTKQQPTHKKVKQNNNQQTTTHHTHKKTNKTTTQHKQASQTQNHQASQTKATSTSNGDDNTSHKGSNNSNSGKSVSVEATAYSAHCSGCSGVTSQGIDLDKNPDKKVIAVDPDVIKPGSTVEVPGYGEAVAGDTGGDIKGNRIDIYKSDKDAANSYGRKNITVKVKN